MAGTARKTIEDKAEEQLAKLRGELAAAESDIGDLTRKVALIKAEMGAIVKYRDSLLDSPDDKDGAE